MQGAKVQIKVTGNFPAQTIHYATLAAVPSPCMAATIKDPPQADVMDVTPWL